jgi:hypothetical protein
MRRKIWYFKHCKINIHCCTCWTGDTKFYYHRIYCMKEMCNLQFLKHKNCNILVQSPIPIILVSDVERNVMRQIRRTYKTSSLQNVSSTKRRHTKRLCNRTYRNKTFSVTQRLWLSVTKRLGDKSSIKFLTVI